MRLMLFHIIGGLTPPTSGEVRVAGQDLAAMTDAGRGDYATANTLIEQLNASLTKLATDTPKTAC